MKLRKRAASLMLAFVMALGVVTGVQVHQAPEASAFTQWGGTLWIGGNQHIKIFYQTGGYAGTWYVIANRYANSNGAFLATDYSALVRSALCDTWGLHQSGTGGWSFFEMRNGSINYNTGNVWVDDTKYDPYAYGSYAGCGYVDWPNDPNDAQGAIATRNDGTFEPFVADLYYGYSSFNAAAVVIGNVCSPQGTWFSGGCGHGPAWVQRAHWWT